MRRILIQALITGVSLPIIALPMVCDQFMGNLNRLMESGALGNPLINGNPTIGIDPFAAGGLGSVGPKSPLTSGRTAGLGSPSTLTSPLAPVSTTTLLNPVMPGSSLTLVGPSTFLNPVSPVSSFTSASPITDIGPATANTPITTLAVDPFATGLP